jgi:hypothetical protein
MSPEHPEIRSSPSRQRRERVALWLGRCAAAVVTTTALLAPATAATGGETDMLHRTTVAEQTSPAAFGEAHQPLDDQMGSHTDLGSKGDRLTEYYEGFDEHEVHRQSETPPEDSGYGTYDRKPGIEGNSLPPANVASTAIPDIQHYNVVVPVSAAK